MDWTALTPDQQGYACAMQGQRMMVKTIQENECFGEVALVTKGTARAADCVAKGPVVLLAMARDAFERLMGPVEEVLSEKVAEYARLNAQLSSRPGSLTSTVPLLQQPSSFPLKQDSLPSEVQSQNNDDAANSA